MKDIYNHYVPQFNIKKWGNTDDRVEQFNEKCVLIEKMSITCLEIKQLYTADEVKFINGVFDEIKALKSEKKKYRNINKYIDWLPKELDNQTRLV